MKERLLRNSVLLIGLIGLCCAVSACSKKTDTSRSSSSEGSELVVYTVNYPLSYFAKQIGGEWAEVKFPAPAHEDPAYWQPDAAAIEGYQKADLIVFNGAGYAKWTERVSLPTSKCVNTSLAFQGQYIALEATMTHSHGPGAEHAHGGVAFTTWLDFSLAAKQAEVIKDAFIKRLPDHKSVFEANYAALEKDLLALDESMKAIAETIKDTPLVVSHPVYQYWAKGYGLNVQSVHWEPDEVPTEQQWQEFKVMLTNHPSKWMIWEDEPLPQSVERLKKMGIQSVVFSPCGNRPGDGDFVSVIKSNVANLGSILTSNR